VRRHHIIIAVLLAIVVIAGLTMWHFRTAGAAVYPAQKADVQAQTIPVTVIPAVERDIPAYLQALGTVKAIDTVSVLPRVSGPITQMLFRPGDDVKQGQELFEIDPRPYQAALDQAQGQLAHDQAALAEARLDLARYQELAKTNAAPRQQAADQAFVVEQDEATVKLDEANVETAKLNLGFCRIVSPIDGRTGALQVDVGNIVQPTSATPLVTITQLHPIYVSFSIPAKSLDEVRQNQAKAPLDVEARSQIGNMLGTGLLTLIDNQVNTTTDTVNLQATFANQSLSLWPGQFVTVRLTVSMRKNVITVPQTAVIEGPGGFYIYVVAQDGTAHRVTVQVMARQDSIDVISGNVKSGEQIVTDGQYRLTDKIKVRVQQKKNPS
jgi:membrane fusion protein, multidrug efflux system